MIDRVDAVVVGAGVIGLAVGRALAMRGLEVLILERHRRAGEETSSRNSGVIHSGIYYAPGSLKATLCVRGRELIYDFCERRGVGHRRCGKLIVAQTDQVEALRRLGARASTNGVTNLAWLESAEVQRLEPQVHCAAALLSPSTGILDVPDYVNALQAEVEAHRGVVVFQTTMEDGRCGADGFRLQIRSGDETISLHTHLFVNAAGLHAVGVAAKLEGYPAERLPMAHYAKGNYFTCRGPRPFSHLVYPMPNEAGLGVHATLGLDDSIRFGPDVQWVDAPNYQVDAERATAFYPAIREYWPALAEGALLPDYAGVRPKIVGPGVAAADFIIEGPREHGVPGLVNLFGMESPGLTSSLAIGELVDSMLRKDS